MGVIPTGAIYKTLTFDGKSSSEFNVYITGEAVFNAPEKAVEMVSIAGRNGAFALDYGRFENIEVTYNCGIVADDETDFAGAISDFRNWLCSRNGYVRLSDDYNTGEYRQAIYKSGLEVETARLIAGEFPIVFECKPQRFLTSGETAVAVTSGNDITNPTLFDARPQLQIWGYGNFSVGNNAMEIISTNIGWVNISEAIQTANSDTTTGDFDDTLANSNDEIRNSQVYAAQLQSRIYPPTGKLVSDVSITGLSLPWLGNYAIDEFDEYGDAVIMNMLLKSISFSYGTAYTTTATANYTITLNDNTTHTGTCNLSISYDGGKTMTATQTYTLPAGFSRSPIITMIFGLKVNSSQSALGSPIYFDLDIGEAYKIENGVPVSVNNAVTIPAELPTLPAGNTTITYDNTITQFKVVPRWWKI